MPRVLRYFLLAILAIPVVLVAQDTMEGEVSEHINNLKEPLYSPFVERYVLDELRQLRAEQANGEQQSP